MHKILECIHSPYVALAANSSASKRETAIDTLPSMKIFCVRIQNSFADVYSEVAKLSTETAQFAMRASTQKLISLSAVRNMARMFTNNA